MEDKDKIKKELKQVAPSLEKHSGETPFSVPGNYFETLPQDIRKRREQLQKKQHTVFSRLGIPQFAYALTVAVFLIFAGYFIWQKETPQAMNGYTDDALFDEYFAYYADYQSAAYYDMVLGETLEEAEDEEFFATFDNEDEFIDYIATYGDYYMQSPIDVENSW